MNGGAFGENFPYSNFHDLNMDWIIKVVKDFLDHYTTMDEEINKRVLKPVDDPNGRYGDILISLGNGGTMWSGDDEWSRHITEAVSEWLDEHPEATTTVLDNSLVRDKFTTALINNLVLSYPTLTQLKADTKIPAQTFAVTGGYYNNGDNGSALYFVTDTLPETHYETLENGLYAKLVYAPTMYVEVFGAVGNGVTDDYNAIMKCAATGHITLTAGKTYAIGTELNIDDVIVEGNGACIIPLSTLIYVIKCDNIKNLRINGAQTNTRFGILHKSTNNAIYQKCIVENIKCSDNSAVGIFINDDKENTTVIIEECIVHDIASTPDGVIGNEPGASTGINVYSKSQVIIRNNIIYDLPVNEDSTGIGIYNKLSNVICEITNNIIMDVHNDAIKNEKPGTIISGNTIILEGTLFQTTYGVRNLASYTKITNNYFYGGDLRTPLNAILITNEYNAEQCIIDSNIFDAPHSSLFITVRSSNSRISNMKITTDSTDATTDIYAVGTSGNHNIFDNLTILSTGSILAFSMNGNEHIVENNNIQGGILTSYVEGIRFFNNVFNGELTASGSIAKCIFENNSFLRFLITANADDLKLVNNTFTDENFSYNMAFGAASNNIIITNNTFKTKHSGIIQSGGTKIVITGNIFTQDTTAIDAPYGSKKVIANNSSLSGVYIATDVTNSVVVNNV